MKDMIYRQAAIDVIDKYSFDFPQYMERFVTELRDAMKADLKDDVLDLPSAQLTLSDEDRRLIKQLRSYHNGTYAKVLDKLMAMADADLSGFFDKLWQTAYERGKAEAQPEQNMIDVGELIDHISGVSLYYHGIPEEPHDRAVSAVLDELTDWLRSYAEAQSGVDMREDSDDTT